MDFLHDPFGLQTEHMNTCQMLVRAVVVFFTALIMIRIAGTRTMSRKSAFDQLTMLIIGSILGRAVVTGTNFFGILAATLLIVLIHRALSVVTFHSKFLGKIFKGAPVPLIQFGKMLRDNMIRTHVTEEDIRESLHLKTNSDNLNDVREAYLERSGHISFVKEKE